MDMDELAGFGAKGGRAGGPGSASPATGASIDREAEQPVYAQLADILRRQILAGLYRPGERLPSEAMLVELYDLSPMTVRRAINLLAAQDVVTTAQGRGVFVKEVELGSAAFYLYDLKELFNDEAGTTVKILEARFTPADERVSRKLQIETGCRAIYIRRLLLWQDEPAFYHRGYLIYDPARPVIESELEVADLRGLFQGSGSALIKSGDLYLESTLLSEEEAQLLKLERPAPGMVLEHIFYDFDDRPVSWGWFVASSKRLRLHTRVGIEFANETRDERAR
jgi:GntR family transcriptional regulator